MYDEGCVFDLETDGIEYPTKIHCLVYQDQDGELVELLDYESMRAWLANQTLLIGHNIQRYDIPVLERILGIEIKAKAIDTLALSWYLEPNRMRHGLAEWGEDFGIPKPKVEDWENQPIEVYVHRCREDVRINIMLWDRISKHLLELYRTKDMANRLIGYLRFKMRCAVVQEANRWKLDKDRCLKVLRRVIEDKQIKTDALEKHMPPVPRYVKKKKPAKPYKQDGSLSVAGTAWFDLLKSEGLPSGYDGVINTLSKYDPPNAGSVPQLKDWLFSLGWEPATFKYQKKKDSREVRKIPQVNLPDGQGLCPSIKLLYDKEPSLELLDGLFVLTHRKGLLQGFLNNMSSDGYVRAEIQGLTNTLRFIHKVCVNIPGVDKPYGEDIRGCLIAPDGYELCGSDMSSLEDRTKQHYMWKYDPDYVREMMAPDFDPHLDLCLSGGMMTEAEVAQYKGADNKFKHTPVYKELHKTRQYGKAGNYSSVYGASPPTVARSAGISLDVAERVVDAYWERNWAVKRIAEDCKVVVVRKQKWLYNPVSKLWYSLRYEKDRFSTLNQGTGAYCFDVWVKYILKEVTCLIGQFHDEVVLCTKIGDQSTIIRILRNSIRLANDELKLNRELDIDIQFGNTYADIH
jgi:hypothetical protein